MQFAGCNSGGSDGGFVVMVSSKIRFDVILAVELRRRMFASLRVEWHEWYWQWKSCFMVLLRFCILTRVLNVFFFTLCKSGSGLVEPNQIIRQEKIQCASDVMVLLDSYDQCFSFLLEYFFFFCPTCNISGLCSSSKGSASDSLQRTVETANIYISSVMHETENDFSAVCYWAHLFIHRRLSGHVHGGRVGTWDGMIKGRTTTPRIKLDIDSVLPDLVPELGPILQTCFCLCRCCKTFQLWEIYSLGRQVTRNLCPKSSEAIHACLCTACCFSTFAAWKKDEKAAERQHVWTQLPKRQEGRWWCHSVDNLLAGHHWAKDVRTLC